GKQFADLRVGGRVVEAAVLGEIDVAVDEVDLVRAALIGPDQFGDPDRDAGDDPAASVDRAWWGTHIGCPVPNWGAGTRPCTRASGGVGLRGGLAAGVRWVSGRGC